MINGYTLVYPNGDSQKIRIAATLAVGDTIEWGNKFTITGIHHKLDPQRFDEGRTHDVVSFVELELV